MEIKSIYINTNNIVETAREDLSIVISALQYFVITSLEKLFDPSNLSLTINPKNTYIKEPIKRQKRPKSPPKKTKRFYKRGNKIGFFIGDHFIPYCDISEDINPKKMSQSIFSYLLPFSAV